jgi:hypothetical protein
MSTVSGDAKVNRHNQSLVAAPFIVSGSKPLTNLHASCSSSSSPTPKTFVRIVCDSRSWVRARSRTIHCPYDSPPTIFLALTGSAAGVHKTGVEIEISWRSLCLGVIVLSTTAIHPGAQNLSNRNATSLSFVASDKSTEAVEFTSASGSSCQVQVPPEKQKEHTVASNFNVFQGIRTRLHQSRHPPEVFLEKPFTLEVPETNTVRQV